MFAPFTINIQKGKDKVYTVCTVYSVEHSSGTFQSFQLRY